MLRVEAKIAGVLVLGAFVSALTSSVGEPQQESARSRDANAALETLLSGDAVDGIDASVWMDVREFYRQRNGACAWLTGQKSEHALGVLRTASAHGLAPELYGELELTQLDRALRSSERDGQDRAQDAATFDARLTGALLSLGHDVAVGRARPELAARHWKTRRETQNVGATLNQALAGDVDHWLDTIQPRHPEYAGLQRALSALRDQQRRGGWPTIAARSLTPGQSHAAVVALRKRLAISGDLTESVSSTTADPTVYDGDVRKGVQSFQFHHGLNETGIADAATVAAMNVPLDERTRQVELNIERWRRMPDDLGSRHLFVNIPSYRLVAREGGKPTLELKVVVGKPGTETPIFSSAMTTVVFSPYWNIPDSIRTHETAPAIAKDPNYLTKNAIEVLHVGKSKVTPVDPATVDWGNPAEVRQLALRQRPGPRNALGHVKFLLPNSYDVYLHDTPSVRLFSRGGRAFSHGCVRVDEPEKLAAYVLRDDEAWDESRIDRAMQSGIELSVRLHESIPVHIVYFTAWVDEGGGLHFGPDVYKYDRAEPQQVR